MVADGMEGYLLRDSGDIAELAAVLAALAADAHLRARMGAAARSKAANFTWDRTAAETLSVYRELLRRRAARIRENSLCQ